MTGRIHNDPRTASAAGQPTWLSRVARRELVAVLIGAAALVTAAAVGAQSADEASSEPRAATAADIPRMVKQATGLMNRIKSMYDDAVKAGNEAQGRGPAAVDCTREILKGMQGPHKLAQASYGSLQLSAKEQANDVVAAEIQKEYERIGQYYEAMVTLHGRLQGCGGPTGSSVVDGEPLAENTNDMKTTTSPNGGDKGTDNLSDIQVGAEASKVGSEVVLDK